MVMSDTTGPDGEDDKPIEDNDAGSPDSGSPDTPGSPEIGDDTGEPTPFDETPDDGVEAEPAPFTDAEADASAEDPEENPFAADDSSAGEELDTDTAELELGDDDDRLPWLEGDEDYEEPGQNTAQLVMAVLLGVLALALIVGGIWWATRAGPDPELVADGGVIEAPDAPYKEHPENPGGKTFEGTGDSSFAVSDGQTRSAQLGDGNSPPKPGFDSVDGDANSADGAAKPAAKPTPSATASPAPAATPASTSSGPAVQVAAYSSRATAEAGWNALKQQYSDLSGMRYRIVEGQADIGTVYRVQALPGDKAAANALCRKLKAAGQNCHVKN